MEVDRKSGISNTALILDGIHVIPFLDIEGNWHSVDDIQGLREDETQKV